LGWLSIFDSCNYDYITAGDFIDIVVVSGLLIFCSIVFLLKSRRIRSRTSNLKRKYMIPDGRIMYSDLNVPAKTLFSKRYGLTGKPDYIVKKDNQYTPIEVKSSSQNYPQKSHMLQLAAYCQLIEDNYKTFVPYGIIAYKNTNYKISFDPKLRFELESTIKKMRIVLKKKKVELNHNDVSRCVSCSMRSFCKSKLI